MLVIGLDGKEYKWNLRPNKADDQNRSKPHLLARALIRELYPYEVFREEVTLPGTKTIHNRPLIADFFLPLQKIIVEVDGGQHDKYNPFFHKNKMGFLKAKARDRKKEEWCILNNITLIKLKQNESIDVWRSKF